MKTVTTMVLTCAAVVAVSLLAMPPVNADTINLPKDTLVKLRFTDPVSTRTATVGQQVNMRVAEDVYLGTKLIIKTDESLVSTITEVQKPRTWGRSGKLNLEFGMVKAVDGSQVALGPWTKDKKQGYGKAAGATVGGAMILGPVGLVGGMFVKGKNIDVPVGQEVVSAVRWDTSIALIDEAVQPVAALPAPAVEAATPMAVAAPPVAPVAPAPVSVTGAEAATTTVAPPVAALPAPAPVTVQPPKPVQQAAPVNAEAKPSVVQQAAKTTPDPPKVTANPSSKTVAVKASANQVQPVIPVIEEVTPKTDQTKKR